MRYQNVIFDLDGTLTDSGEGIINSAAYAFEQLGLPVPDRAALRKMVGPPLSVGFPLLGVPDAQVDEAIRLYRVRYNEGGGKLENRVYGGIEDCLKALKAAGMKLYVGTSKPESLAREILSGFRLTPYFDYIAGASWDKSRQNKDDVLRYLLTVIGGADGAIMVGDTQYDVLGAHARKLPCIGVTWGYGTHGELQNAGADTLVSTPKELQTYLFEDPEKKDRREHMITVYGSPLCPDCRECKANFELHGIAYEEVDITASMKSLKAFLKLRDTLAVFDPCKKQGSVGIPAIVSEDGAVMLDWEGFLTERGLPVVYRENGPACSLDGKGC